MFGLPKSQQGLEQFGNTPFFYTPNTPASPSDCNRYPNSPLCGGNPINVQRAVGYDYDLVFDECNLGIQIKPTFGYIRLPNTQLIYRHSNCPTPQLPPPEKIPKNGKEPSKVIWNPLNTNDLWIGSSPYYLEYEDGVGRGRIPNGYAKIEMVSEITEFGKISNYRLPNNNLATHRLVNKVYQTQTVNSSWFKSYASNGQFVAQETINFWLGRGGIIEGNPQEDDTLWTLELERVETYYIDANSYPLYFDIRTTGDSFGGGGVWLFRQQDRPQAEDEYRYFTQTFTNLITRDPSDFPLNVKSDYEPRNIEIVGTGADYYGSYYALNAYYVKSWIGISKFIQFESDNAPPLPLLKEEEKEECCMACCAEMLKLLKLILKRIGDLPATVPNSLVRANSGVKTIDSLAEYIAYSVIQTNNQFGQFPQEITIQDADLTQEGDQQKKITLPNLAESIAEMIGILLVLQSESNANLIATVNSMIEAGSAKQLALLASDYAAANAEFLGYKGKQVERKVAFSFKPGEQRLDRMLQPGEVKVKGWDNDDKNDLNDTLMPILEMVSMYRAQNFRNIGTGDTLEKLRDILKSGANIATSIDNLVNNPPPPSDPNAPPNTPPKSSWDEFVEQAETGFISKPGITDNLHPYGRPLEQRPKIREFGADTSEDPTNEQ